MSKDSGGSVVSGALLIAGTSVGAGMLALPFATGVAGFGPAIAVSAVCWLYMLITGLYFLEVTLWMPDGANVLSMTRHFLGRTGWVIGGACFIYLYYCLMIAYFSGGAPIFTRVISSWLQTELQPMTGLIFFTLFFGCIIYLGHKVTGRINYILMAGLILSYVALISVGADDVDFQLLKGGNWSLAIFAAPTLFSAYGYHNVIPSVSTYMKRHATKLRWAVIVGTLFPFAIYTLWQWVVIGSLPQEVIALTLESGAPITEPLEVALNSRWFPIIARYFSLFAIVTSIIGVSLSMVDFLGDGTKIPRQGWGRLLLCLLVFIPPFALAGSIPGLFFKALHYAGGFGEVVLNGILPASMVWVGRYRHKRTSEFALPGGKPLLLITLGLGVAVVIWQCLLVTMGLNL